MDGQDDGTRLQRALAANMLRLRTAAGMSQRDLAAAAGTRQALVSDVELGRANPTLLMLERFANALSVEPTQLLTASKK